MSSLQIGGLPGYVQEAVGGEGVELVHFLEWVWRHSRSRQTVQYPGQR